MFIQIQATPNPNTLKFVLDENILHEGETYSFSSAEESTNSPMSLEIFNNPDVVSIFIGSDFVSVTIKDHEKWEDLQHHIISIITHYANMGKIITDLGAQKEVPVIKGSNEAEQKVIDEISTLFEERIRPAVAMDGGDIMFVNYKDGIVFIKMYGACSGCPSAGFTLKSGIENMLKYYVEEVKEVVNIEEQL